MDFRTFKDQVSSRFNLSLESYKETQLKRRIDSHMLKKSIVNYGEFLRLLSEDSKVLEGFKEYITINVSEFFRNPHLFSFLETKVLPELLKDNLRLKIWSAACSNGSEPYSIAMILADISKGSLYNIDATDIDDGILKKAQAGRYYKEELKNISNERIRKYFRALNEKFEIDLALKSKIKFRKHDLLKDIYLTGYDLIVCRNVTIYFTKEAQDDIYSKFVKSLKTNGYLFIGGTENIFNYKSLGLEKISPCFFKKIV